MANRTNSRIIHTGLYTDLAAHVLDHGCLGQLSDGWGEDNPKNAKYWEFMNIKRAEDEEVLLEVFDGYDSYYHVESAFMNKSEREILEWLANILKKTVKMELKDDKSLGEWNRSNTNDGCYFDAKVSEAYLIYETLKGRSRAKSKYLLKEYNEVVGYPITPEIHAKRAALAQIENEKAEQIKKIEAEAAEKIKALNAA